MGQPIVTPEHLRPQAPLKKIFCDLHYHDKNFFGVIVGGTGVGKSGTAIRFCYEMDCYPGSGARRFIIRCDSEGNSSLDTRVVYKISDFLRHATNPNFPKGTFIIWDEAGVDNDNTQWFSLKSRITKYVMQTSRYLNNGIFLTVPDLESISIASKRLMHWVFDVRDRNEVETFVVPHIVSRDRVFKQKTFYPYPTYRDEYGLLHQITRLQVKKPPAFLELPYKKIKEKATQDWYKLFDDQLIQMKQFANENRISSDIDEQLETMDSRGKKMDPLEVANYVLSNQDEFKNPADKKVNVRMIMIKYREKGIVLPKKVADEATAGVNFELSKRRNTNS